MELEKKYFEGLNADDDINLLAETDYINAENFRIGTTDVGSALRLESIGGTIHLHSLLPAPTHAYFPLCAVEDEERRRIIYFMYYTQGTNQIRVHDRATGQNYTVLTQTQADLDFSKNNLIQAKIYGDLLIYTDDKQEIKIINIEAGIKLNHPTYVTEVLPYTYPVGQTRIAFEDITLLRRPPIYAPTFTKEQNGSYLLRFIENQAFKFAYRYFYRDYQTSVVGMWSKLANYNSTDDPLKNFIRVVMRLPPLEVIPQTVIAVELLVKNMVTLDVQVIKVWEKDDTADAKEIADHNLSVKALTYDFYANKNGLDVPTSVHSKTEENIPRWCKTLDTARKRLFLANYLEGFVSPTKTSLKVTAQSAVTTTSITVDVWEARIPSAHHTTMEALYYVAYWVKLDTVPIPGWYELTPTVATDTVGYPPLIPAPPSPIAFTALTWLGVTDDEAARKATPTSHLYALGAVVLTQFTPTPQTTTITGLDIVQLGTFKSMSPYQVGVAFYDRLRRWIGMITNDGLIINIPDRTYEQSSLKTAIKWELNNPPPTLPATYADEIPKEAHYYSIVITENLRTRHFVQTFVDMLRYAKKKEDGTVLIDTIPTTPIDKTYVVIDLQSMIKDGMGWQYTQGDLVRIYYYDGLVSHPGVTLAVVGTEGGGRYLLCEMGQFGTPPADATFTNAHKMLVEVYRPYIAGEKEPFFEIGQMYPIVDPGLPTRTYNTMDGLITGDVYLLPRKSFGNAGFDTGIMYQAEAMSTNDKYWQRWFTDMTSSRAMELFRNREIRRPYSIAFSAVFVIGTQVNGLSNFETFDVEDVSPECGSIQKLLLTSKVQDDGTVMLVIGYAETNTLYLGEAQISDSASTAFFVKTVGVIGSINALRGSYGTQNAESVVLHRGQAYWYDAFNGCFVRYDVNGLFPISDYKMKRVAKLLGDKYLSMSQAQIEALGSRPFIFGGVDPYHNEVMWAIPKLAATPPKGYLMDYISYVEAKGYITITDVGNDGDSIQVFVDDPILGKISLGTVYFKTSTDTTPAILAASLTAMINLNIYGYSATSAFGVIAVTARNGLGASINGGNRLTVSIIPVVVTNILKVGVTDKLLINATDKFII